MTIATLDTNVIVSGLLFDGPPRKVLRAAIAGKYQLVLSPAIIEELTGVLTRRKFGLDPNYVHTVVRELEEISLLVQPSHRQQVVLRDPEDNFIIDCVVEAGANYLVTGDKDLLVVEMVGSTAIVTPAKFLDITGLR